MLHGCVRKHFAKGYVMGEQEFSRIKKLDLENVNPRKFKEILGGYWISHQL